MALGEDKAVQLIKKVLELDPIEFLGICKVLGVSIYETSIENGTVESVEGGRAKGVVNASVTVREFADIWVDVCDAIDGLNRTQKRNLNRLLKAATKKEN